MAVPSEKRLQSFIPFGGSISDRHVWGHLKVIWGIKLISSLAIGRLSVLLGAGITTKLVVAPIISFFFKSMSDLVLDEIEMAESFGFRDLTSSNKASESSRSPIRRPKYQCYDCGGDPMISQICRTCCGTKTVTDSNPMVMFLNSLMAYKLGNEPPPPPENPSLKPQFS